MQLKALYYPYARCFDEATLKRAILLFDEVAFIDPTDSSLRNVLITDVPALTGSDIRDDKALNETYQYLQEEKIVRTYNPTATIAKHDQLLSGALRADLDDDEVWKLCTEPGTPSTWSLLRTRIPPSSFEFLNPQASPRVYWGTARSQSHFHETPVNLSLMDPLPSVAASGPFDPEDLTSTSPDWYRYLVYDDREQYKIESGMRWRDADFEKHLEESRNLLEDDEDTGESGTSRQAIQFVCVLPFTHGSVLNTNTALMIGEKEGYIPFTDSEIHHRLLALKYKTAKKALSGSPRISGVAPLDPEKLRRVALTLVDVMVPDECIRQMSIEDCVRYRSASQESFRRLKDMVGELTVQIESEPWEPDFEKQIQKLVHLKILPEARKARDSGLKVYEQLFGRIAKKAFAALTPSMGASIFTGLSLPAMIALGGAVALGAIMPDVIEAINETRQRRRNGLTYLLKLT